MRILIVEDEPPIADYIEEACRHLIRETDVSIQQVFSLDAASEYVSETKIDLCLLDLNLNGQNGYELLKRVAAGSFHTIVISAYTDLAFHAFEYGVLDFVPKPFHEERLGLALQRFFSSRRRVDVTTKYLTVRDGARVSIIKIGDVLYFKAADNYVEAHLKNNQRKLLDKTLHRLLQILPKHYVQIHRSYVIDIHELKSFGHTPDGHYQVELKNGAFLPLSRTRYKELRRNLNG